ncbi:MAG: RsmB/NOP family class I SAM-dependent RNA methyltransferase [Sandaracinaceae bacterium]
MDRRDFTARYGAYRALVDDWPAFGAAMHAPLPRVMWAHPERLTRAALERILVEDGLAAQRVGWAPPALRLAADAPAGLHWGFWAGLFHLQEEASLLPVRLLGPRPGDRVLDLCAAPGGKTAQIALALHQRGTVVANDRNATRLAALSVTVARLGLRNVTITHGDGAVIALPEAAFDGVLVDAPCTAEGTGRRQRTWTAVDPAFRSWVAGVQRALLRRAADLVRPGGRIVYSTCTFAPEENEGVVDAVLKERGDLTVVPVPPPEGLRLGPGVDAWARPTRAGELLSPTRCTYDPSVRSAVRLWPHHNDTGGFFAAVLERAGTGLRRPLGPPLADACPALEDERVAGFRDAYGLPDEALAGHVALARGRYVRLLADDHVIVDEGPRYVAAGLPLTRTEGGVPKLSTAGGLHLGRSATRRVVEVDRDAAAAFQRREPIGRPAGWRGPPRGFVLVRHRGHPLGLGLVRAELDAIESHLPKAWSKLAAGAGRAP